MLLGNGSVNGLAFELIEPDKVTVTQLWVEKP